MLSCTRQLVGVKYVKHDGSKYYYSIDEIHSLTDNSEFINNIEHLKNKYPQLDFDEIVKNLMLSVGYLDFDYKTKVVPGNVLEVTEVVKERNITPEHVKAFKAIIKDISNRKIRSIYNEIIPDIGDKLYELSYNSCINECESGLSQQEKDVFNKRIDEFQFPDIAKLSHLDKCVIADSIRIYTYMLQTIFDLPKNDDPIEFMSNFDVSKVNPDNCARNAFRFSKFLNEQFLKVIESDKVDQYREAFALMFPGGDILFEMFEKACGMGVVKNYDNENLVQLMQF